MVMMTAESVLSKRRVVRITVALFSLLKLLLSHIYGAQIGMVFFLVIYLAWLTLIIFAWLNVFVTLRN